MGAKIQPNGGYKTIDVCNSNAEKMKERYKKIEAQMNEAYLIIEKSKKEIEGLRREEVQNVLDYVRTYFNSGVLNKNDIDSYLCHCQNTLYGNIDGVFLTFTKE